MGIDYSFDIIQSGILENLIALIKKGKVKEFTIKSIFDFISKITSLKN